MGMRRGGEVENVIGGWEPMAVFARTRSFHWKYCYAGF